jgi:hypothetical protein
MIKGLFLESVRELAPPEQVRILWIVVCLIAIITAFVC